MEEIVETDEQRIVRFISYEDAVDKVLRPRQGYVLFE